jgi:hypothetical protein
MHMKITNLVLIIIKKIKIYNFIIVTVKYLQNYYFYCVFSFFYSILYNNEWNIRFKIFLVILTFFIIKKKYIRVLFH